jgi:preprotein translocase subunit YajC
MILANALLNGIVFAQDAQPTPGDPAGIMYYATLILLVVSMVYFMAIRPQRKEEADRKKMIASLNKGDSIVTHSGIHGKIVEFKDNNETVVINIAKDTNVTFNSSAILKKK